VAPGHLPLPVVREWLSQPHTRDDLVLVASVKLVRPGRPDDAQARGRLAQGCAHYTLEHTSLAGGRIDDVV
jgi:hypothetical protein